MITKDNLRNLLIDLGFQQSNSENNKMSLNFDKINSTVIVDFKNEKIIYPEGLEADRDTTKNFSANENFVVLECIVCLLAQGYKPKNIVLEPKTPGGREDSQRMMNSTKHGKRYCQMVDSYLTIITLIDKLSTLLFMRQIS